MKELMGFASYRHTWLYLIGIALLGYAIVGFTGGALAGSSLFPRLGTVGGGIVAGLFGALIMGVLQALGAAFFAYCFNFVAMRIYESGNNFLPFFGMLIFIYAVQTFLGTILGLIPIIGPLLMFALGIYGLIWFFAASRVVYGAGILATIGICFVSGIIGVIAFYAVLRTFSHIVTSIF